MISVQDKAGNVEINVVGKPFQWAVSIDGGKTHYYMRAEQMLTSIANELSEKAGINHIALDGEEGWSALVSEEKATNDLMQAIASKLDSLLPELSGTEIPSTVIEHDGKKYKETIGKTEDGRTIFHLSARGRPQKFVRNEDGTFSPVEKAGKETSEIIEFEGFKYSKSKDQTEDGIQMWNLITGQRGRPARFIFKDGKPVKV